MNTSDKAILTVTCYGHFLSHFNMLVFPAILLPLSARMGLDMAATLELAFWMYLLFGLTALPWGMLADKIGPRPLLGLFYAGAGCCGLSAALSVDSPLAFKLSLAGIGFFSGIYHPAGLGWIACCVSKTSTGMAYNGMFGNIGLATGPLLAGLVNWLFGAQAVYLSLALLNFTGIFFLLRVRTEQCTRKTQQTSGSDGGSMSGFAVLLVCMMLGGIVYRGATVTLPALFELNGTGIVAALGRMFPGSTIEANVVATLLTSALYLIGMLGQYTGGLAGERFDLRYSYLAFHLMTLPAAFVMGVLLDVPLVLVATVHSFFLLGMQPVENTLVARLTPPSLRSSAYGMKFVVTFGVGALAVQGIKMIEQSHGVEAVFPSLGFVSLALVMAIGVLIRVTPKMKSA
jgi:MFS family permease